MYTAQKCELGKDAYTRATAHLIGATYKAGQRKKSAGHERTMAGDIQSQ